MPVSNSTAAPRFNGGQQAAPVAAPAAQPAKAAAVAQSTIQSASSPVSTTKKAWTARAWDATKDVANKVWQWMKNVFYACFPCFAPKQIVAPVIVDKAQQFLDAMKGKDPKDMTAKFNACFTAEEQKVIKAWIGLDADAQLKDISSDMVYERVASGVTKFQANQGLKALLVEVSKDPKEMSGSAIKKAWNRLNPLAKSVIERGEVAVKYGNLNGLKAFRDAQNHRILSGGVKMEDIDMATRVMRGNLGGASTLMDTFVKLAPLQVAYILAIHAKANLNNPQAPLYIAPPAKA
jgi:hypothetical protein